MMGLDKWVDVEKRVSKSDAITDVSKFYEVGKCRMYE